MDNIHISSKSAILLPKPSVLTYIARLMHIPDKDVCYLMNFLLYRSNKNLASYVHTYIVLVLPLNCNMHYTISWNCITNFMRKKVASLSDTYFRI